MPALEELPPITIGQIEYKRVLPEGGVVVVLRYTRLCGACRYMRVIFFINDEKTICRDCYEKK